MMAQPAKIRVMKNLFITGLSGCVGHYLFDLLKDRPDLQINALVRDPARLKFSPNGYPNLKLIQGELNRIGDHRQVIRESDYLVHLAAEWGNDKDNHQHSVTLLSALDPARCQRVIYFSTASILGEDNRPIREAKEFGTPYIKGKYHLHQELPGLAIYPKMKIIFPTWVFGGDKTHPYSHAASGLLKLKNKLKLVRWFTIDASFHFIHARDLAAAAYYLLEHEPEQDKNQNEYVMGNPLISASDFIRQVCAYYKVPVYAQLPIPLPLAVAAATLTGHKLHPWDRFCFEKRHFAHRTVNAAHFNLPTDLATVGGILKALENK